MNKDNRFIVFHPYTQFLSALYGLVGLTVSSMFFFGCGQVNSSPSNSEPENIEDAPLTINDKIELVDYETGFYEYRDMTHLQLLYQPMIIMKWRNKSNEPLDEMIQVEVLFIKDGEEMANEYEYLQSSSDRPLQPGLSRQIHVQSSVGYTSSYAIYGKNITCQVFVNEELFDSFEIEEKQLTTNRIQSDRKPRVNKPAQDPPARGQAPIDNNEGVGASDYMTVTGNNVNVRSMPDKQGAVLFQLDKGDRCRYIETGGEEDVNGYIDYWYKVEYNDQEGWIFGKFLRKE